MSQFLLAATAGILAASLFTGCQLITVDYVYVASSTGSSPGSAGQIQIFASDSLSGALRPAAATVPSGGTGPVSLATTSLYTTLYCANAASKNVVHFGINNDGSLVQKDTVTTASAPVAIAVNEANTYLYVVAGTTNASLFVYPIAADGTIGALAQTVALTVPGFTSDTILATGITVLANSANVYVSAYDQSAYNPGGSTTSSANPGWIFGYSVGSSGTLTAVSGSPFKAGVKPSSITSDPANRFVYTTDFASNELIGYTIQSGGVLDFMLNGPFKTGNEPSSVTVDPRGIFIYLSNQLDSDVTGYNIALSTGTPSALVNSNASLVYSTDSEPVALIVDPALGRFVYTANRLGNSVSGFKLDADTGVLTQTQATPYPVGSNPSAIAAIPHGNHSTQSVTP